MHVNLENAEKAIEAARKKAIALKTQTCISPWSIPAPISRLSCAWTTPG